MSSLLILLLWPARSSDAYNNGKLGDARHSADIDLLGVYTDADEGYVDVWL